jgi:hypothetical protein
MKKTHGKILTVTSSLNKISTDQLVYRVVVGAETLLHPSPTPFYSRGSGQIFEDYGTFFPPHRISAASTLNVTV